MNVKYIDEKKKYIFTITTYMEFTIYNFGRPFLGHHYYTLSLFDLCLRVEKKIVKELML